MPAGAIGAIRVKGLADLNRALKNADKDVRLGVREVERQVAEPVKLEAQRLAVTEISGLKRTNLKSGGEWGLMRIGSTQKVIYVAPLKRGKKKGTQKRRNFAGVLMDKAMQPALDRKRPLIERRFQQMLDHMADNFNRRG